MPANKLIIHAYVFALRIEAKIRGAVVRFKNLAEAREYARRNGYTGIWVRFH